MNWYSTIIYLHVLAAILGLGPIAALTFGVTRAGARPLTAAQMSALLRWVNGGLVGTSLLGAALVALTRGRLGDTPWMRVSIALFVVLAALLGTARRRVRKAAAEDTPPDKSMRALCWTICGLIAAITYLMEAKPW